MKPALYLAWVVFVASLAGSNRLVYGDRASPHEVLSQVTARLSDGTGAAVVDDLARLLADGTGADQAVVWMRAGEWFRPEGMWSRDELGSAMPAGGTLAVEDQPERGHRIVSSLPISRLEVAKL